MTPWLPEVEELRELWAEVARQAQEIAEQSRNIVDLTARVLALEHDRTQDIDD